LLSLGCPPCEAVRHILLCRGLEGGTGESSEGLEGIWWFRLVVFVLGSLLQVVKIYSMTGIPWTQAWASIYLIAFPIVEIVTQLAGIDLTEGQLDFTDPILRVEHTFMLLDAILSWLGCVVQVVIWAGVCAVPIPTTILYTHKR
jgi:hypothetical protein